jgi:Fe-S cluster assembly iron-binding protein IscA
MFNSKIAKMKNLFFLFSLVVLLGISASVMGQSTGTAPYPGATHTYTATANAGSTFVWSVTKGDLTTAITATDLTLTNGTTAVATILWASTVTTGTDYYVRVVETNGGCSNTKILKVTPVPSAFNVVIAADNTTDCYDAAPTVALNSGVIEYTHGTSTVSYTFTQTNTQGNWKFDFANTAVTGWTWAAPTVTGGTATISGNTVTATAATPVQLTFVVTKTAVTTNAGDAAGSGADFTSEITVSNGKSGTGFTISDNGSGTKSASTPVSRPHTTNIVTD